MGVAFYLSGQEVSSSPLGVVHTLAEKANEIATAYCTAIGSDTYKTNLSSLLLKMMKAGIYDKLSAIYPILGDTLAKQRINIISPGTYDMFVAANASAGADGKHIVFSNRIGVGAQTPPVISTGTFSIYSVLKKDSVYNSAMMIHFSGRADYQDVGTFFNSGSYSGVVRLATAPTTTPVPAGGIISSIQRFAFTYDATTDKAYTSLNGGEIGSGTGNNRQGVRMNTGFGAHWYNARNTTAGASQDGDTNEFGGDLWFYALGKLSINESITMDSMVAEFLTDVKEISF